MKFWLSVKVSAALLVGAMASVIVPQSRAQVVAPTTVQVAGPTTEKVTSQSAPVVIVGTVGPQPSTVGPQPSTVGPQPNTVDPQPSTVGHGPNSAAQQAKPYVVLVSLDGFRYDYARRDGARHLLAMAARGASAPEGMIPAYPSLTFPNHLSLVTGLYPEHHGIVANNFLDPARKQRYDAKSSVDGSWYSGTPLWVLAEKQGMRTACFFWPGSEAEIQGTRPSYYMKFDDMFPDEKRVDQVLAWLRMPEAQRPHFITLYYSNVDGAGHEYGPDAPHVTAEVTHVDGMIGKLVKGIEETRLPVNLVVVSDHGMVKVEGPWITLDEFKGDNLVNFDVSGSLLYAKGEEDAEKEYKALRAASPDFVVYRRKKVPSELHYDSNVREGDPVIVALAPVAIRAHGPAAGKEDKPPNKGAHGYDAREMPEMRAIFFAAGPAIRAGVAVAPFENVNLYPLLVHILGLESGPVDGKLSVLSSVLVDNGGSE